MNEPMNEPTHSCGYHVSMFFTSIAIGLVLGYLFVYLKWVAVAVIAILVCMRLAVDFYQLNIKGEGDVKDDNSK